MCVCVKIGKSLRGTIMASKSIFQDYYQGYNGKMIKFIYKKEILDIYSIIGMILHVTKYTWSK